MFIFELILTLETHSMSAKIYKFLPYISISAMIAVIVGQILWTSYSQKIIRQAGFTLIQLSLAKSSHDFNQKIDRIVEAGGEKPSFNDMQLMIDSSLKKEFESVIIFENLEYSIYRANQILYKSNANIKDEEVLNSDLSRGFFYEKNKPAMMVSIIAPASIGYSMNLSHMNIWWLMSMFGFATIAFIAILLLRSMQKAKLDANLRVKTINNIAHEFKTPIASIKLAGEMLVHEDVAKQPERVHRYAELIQYEIKRLQSQTEQFQNVVLLEEGQIMLRFRNINANEVLQKLVNHYVLVRGDYQDRLSTDLKADNDFIYVDGAHFENVITNLIDNAFKYGGEKVNVKVTTRSNEDCLMILVSDDGNGIAKEHQRLIFERFYRVAPINKHDVKGHGIGLYYVKTILKQMGAEITVQSSIGKGATFEIIFPFETNNQEK
ncbi:Adaptive-response sensory-kinase SasA [anaerobic digester metagenome]